MESSQAVLALDLVDTEADLAERVVLILLEIGERDLEDTALESVVGVLETGGSVHEGLADTAKFVNLPYPTNFFFEDSSRGRHSLSNVEGVRGLEKRVSQELMSCAFRDNQP